VAKARGQTFGNPGGAAPLVKHRKRGIRNSLKVRTERADDFARRIAAIVADVRVSGIDTAKGIARELNARDIEAPRGGQWGATQVRRVIGRLD
jgi:Recombinase